MQDVDKEAQAAGASASRRRAIGRRRPASHPAAARSVNSRPANSGNALALLAGLRSRARAAGPKAGGPP
jgi:hypothetical protein